MGYVLKTGHGPKVEGVGECQRNDVTLGSHNQRLNEVRREYWTVLQTANTRSLESNGTVNQCPT